MRKTICLSIAAFFFSRLVYGQVFDERFDDWPVDLKINGTIVVSESEKAFEQFLGKTNPKSEEQRLVLFTNLPDNDELASVLSPKFKSVASKSIDQELENAESFDVFVWHDTRQATEIGSEQRSRMQNLLVAHIKSGKAVFVIGPHAKLVSENYVVASDQDQPAVEAGLNLLPDCVLETGFVERDSMARLLRVLKSHPRSVGIGLEQNTILVFSGRKIMVSGEGRATFMLPDSEHLPVRTHSISEMKLGKQPDDWLVDLTEWRRDAIDRTLEPFPPSQIEEPRIDNGALVIVGGGRVPDGLMKDFVHLARGPNKAKLVYVPCSEDDDVSSDIGMLRVWEELGVAHTSMIHTKDREQANSDEQLLLPLRDATGIWFGGGRQWNLSDSYYGTTAHRLMKEVLHRGGVIGGSSAGASIQARYLARATPIENYKIMAPGYERGGLGFISGVAIDQHFSQRRRQKDMTELVNRYQQLLGIGIDESTAIVVKKSVATVVGKGKVHFYDRNVPVEPDHPDYVAIEAGKAYDLVKRQIVESSE
jgi:cyanophycinase